MTPAVIVAAAAGFWLVSRSGSGALERWIGSQIQLIANSYLNPQIQFTDLDYTYPGTVSLENMRLMADDPANPGKTIDILSCNAATLTLAEVPKIGQPIAIQRITLRRPLFAAVALSANSRKLVGFSDMVRGEPKQRRDPSSRPVLSDVLRIREIELVDGKIIYDPRIPGTEPMELDQITTRLNVEPADAGWYKLATIITRKPVFEFSIAGQLNLDHFEVRDVAAKLVAELAEEKLTYLPPQLQKWLNKYHIRGTLNVSAAGSMPFRHPKDGDMQVAANLADGDVTLGEYRVAVDKLDLSAKLHDQRLSLDALNVDALRGSLQLSGATTMNDMLDTEMTLQIDGMLLEELLAGRIEGQAPKIAGKLNAQMRAAAPLKVVMIEARSQPREVPVLPENWGSATINVSDGRLVALPVIHDLSDAIISAGEIVGVESGALGEKLDVAFQFSGNEAKMTEMAYVSRFAVARGKGTVALNGTLDLTVHGGPVEKVQEILGKDVGGFLGKVTDAVMAYRVTGTLAQPKVDVAVGGGALDEAGKAVGTGMEKIGEGIEKLTR